MRPHAAKIDEEDKNEPESQRPLLVQLSGLCELELRPAAGEVSDEGRRKKEGQCVQLVEEGVELQQVFQEAN